MQLEHTAGIFLQVSWRIHMLPTPPAGNWAPHYTANTHLSQSTLALLHHSFQGQKARQKDLISTNLSPWVYGASQLQSFPSAHMLPLHMLSQGDPAFGTQQESTVGGFSDWLLHKVLRFQVPCLPLPHTLWVLVYLRNFHSFGRGISTLLVIVSQEKMHFITQYSWLPFVAGINSPCPCSSPSRNCAGVVTAEFRPSLCAQLWDRQPLIPQVLASRGRMRSSPP